MRKLGLPLGIWLALVCALSQAQILIGQTTGVTGAVAAAVEETNAGAKLYIDAINAKGGIGGEKIQLITLDDQFNPQLAAANARELIEQRKVVAMFLTRGTPHTEAIIPILEQYGVPLIGPSTGAMVLRAPVRKQVFNVRASYQREAERAIAHLTSMGVTRIAVAHVDDSFGQDGLEGAKKGLAAAHLQALWVEKFDRNKPDFTAIAPLAEKTQAQAVMLIGTAPAVVAGIRAIKATGSKTRFMTLSNNASDGFLQLLGDDATGVIVSQVFPSSLNFALVRDATRLAQLHNIPALSPAMLEGFASAKVLVEALRRSGNKPSRERVQAALEGMQAFDLGGMELSYSNSNHNGLDFSDLSIVNASRKFMR